MARNDNTFKKGNKAAVGHGRPSVSYRTAVEEVLSTIHKLPSGESAVQVLGQDLKQASMIQLAQLTLIEAMLGRDENGNVTAAGVRAAVELFHALYGRPKQQAEVKIVGEERSVQVIALLSNRLNALALQASKGRKSA